MGRVPSLITFCRAGAVTCAGQLLVLPCEAFQIQVRSDARGAGLGQLLVLSCEACAREWGLSEVMLLVEAGTALGNTLALRLYTTLALVMLLVEAGNAPALRLYTSLGYQEVWTREVESARPPSPGAAEMAAASVLTSALVKAI
ncbi:hypothetical protein T484DRAFT_1820196 [Baffinella frigidus]|nr:hypothetical protein T484DRAFT_1820196 [Cryptophyta sp. CCMP2293]